MEPDPAFPVAGSPHGWPLAQEPGQGYPMGGINGSSAPSMYGAVKQEPICLSEAGPHEQLQQQGNGFMSAPANGSAETSAEHLRELKERAKKEKNRQAVRNCRQRKRKYSLETQERIRKLLEENEKLRLELKLCGEEKTPSSFDMDSEEKDLINDMEVLIKAQESASPSSKNRSRSSGHARSDAEAALRRKIQMYVERHQDHGRGRQNAIAFILDRLQRLVTPANITKHYMYLMTEESNQQQKKEWAALKVLLEITPEQDADFTARTLHVKRLRTELDCAFEKMKSIVKRCRRNKKVGDAMNELTTILKPEQFARFVVWVHNNPACKDILDNLWEKLLAKCDEQINAEIQSNPAAMQRIKLFQENSAALAIRMFSSADHSSREAVGKLCVHPNVILVDANNNVDKRGLKSLIKYASYVSHAFDTQSCDKTKALRALNVEEQSIVSDQQDDKITGTWRLSGVYIGRLRPRRRNSPGRTPGSGSPSAPFGFNSGGNVLINDNFKLPSVQGSDALQAKGADGLTSPDLSRSSAASVSSDAPEPLLSKEEQLERTVAFNLMVEFSFADPVRPELITEMIISWDAMSLVNQLGLLKRPSSLSSGLTPPPPSKIPRFHEASNDTPHTPKEKDLAQPKDGARSPAIADHFQPTEVPTKIPSNDTPKGTEAVDTDKDCAPESPASQDIAETNALKLSELFGLQGAAFEKLANEILEPKCVFDDIHLGPQCEGVSACLKYISNLRRAFPKFDITATVLSRAKVTPNEAAYLKRTTASSSPVAISPMASPRVSKDSSLIPEVIELGWSVAAQYGGELVESPRPCQVNGKVFAFIHPTTGRISSAKLDIVPQDFMQQIGILAG
mmetsp:Transcript_1283/g.2552  ORF Transcript_1283/g.2552 Transcript_1283/m.2552 type:complete len:852 (+) Transcript_1283:213-2768(+)